MVLLVAWGIAQGSPLWGWYQLKTLALPGHPVQCPPTAWYKPDRHPISRAIFLRPMLSLYHSFNFPSAQILPPSPPFSGCCAPEHPDQCPGN